MTLNFKITGIQKNTYSHLFDLNKSELGALGAIKMLANEKPGYPCRVSLQDAEIGEEVILLTYEHHQTPSPYRAKGPIFIRKVAQDAQLGINEIPHMLEHRLLSIRVYDSEGMMIDALTKNGKELRAAIITAFADDKAQYIHVHNASPGCYNCQIQRI